MSAMEDPQIVKPELNPTPRSHIAVWVGRRGVHPASVVANALSLFGTTVVTSLFGFAFWVVAAHTFSSTAIGAGSAAISAMQLLATASMLGLGTLLIGELSSGAAAGAALLSTALITSVLVGIASGFGFAFVLHAASVRDEVPWGPVGVGLFALTTGMAAALLVFDDATVGLSRASWQFWRNLAFSILKLVALPIAVFGLGLDSATGLMGTWFAGALLSITVVAVLARRAGARPFVRPRRHLFRSYGGTALTHHCLNVSSQAPRLLLPVLVVGFLTPATNARFYTAILLVSFAYLVPAHLSTALFGLGRKDRAALSRELRRTMRISTWVAVASLVIFGLGGRFMLSLFGPGYGDAAVPLIILSSATFFRGVRLHYIAVCRVNGDLGRCALISCAASGLEVALVLLALLLHGGLVLVSTSWVLAMVIQAGVLWPAVAVAGGLPRGRRPGRLVDLMRWTAPRTFAETAS